MKKMTYFCKKKSRIDLPLWKSKAVQVCKQNYLKFKTV